METRDYTNYTTTDLIAEYNQMSDDRHAAAIAAHELVKRLIVFDVEIIQSQDATGSDELILEVQGPGEQGRKYTSLETASIPDGGTEQFVVQFGEILDLKEHYQKLHDGKPIEFTIYEVDTTGKDYNFHAKWHHGLHYDDGFENGSWSNDHYRVTVTVK